MHGRQIRLGTDQKVAHAEFYRIMAAEGRLDHRQAARMKVADAREAIVGTVAHSRPNTVRLYRDMLGPFRAHFARDDSTS